MLHHIQKDVLDLLATSESLRYGELKPAALDGNVFGYHLKMLIRDNYVAKQGDGSYALTATGKDYIVHRHEDPLLQAHSIFLIVVQRGDHWLMRRRLVQPHLGLAGFIHGEPQADEDIITTAQRRLQEKTGLTTPLSIHSSALITISQDGAVESYSHAIILTGATDDDITVERDVTGEQFWCKTSELAVHDRQFLPSCLDILTQIQAGEHSFLERSYHL